MRHPTVLASHLRDDGVMDGCNHYRFRIPFEELRRRVDGGVFDWSPMGKTREWALANVGFRPTDYDIMIFPRHRPIPYAEGELDMLPESLVNGAEVLGVPLEGESHLLDLVPVLELKQSVVLEYDDDYFTNSRDLKYNEHGLLHKLLNRVSAVTVSTSYLQGLVRRYAPTTPVYVLENSINWDEWQGHKHLGWTDPNNIVIGLTGSPTHADDWFVLKDVIPAILSKHSNVSFLGAGFLPDYFKDMVENNNRADFAGAFAYEDYPVAIRQSDITLCPVVPEDEFNLSKSAIKAIEGLAASRELSDGNIGGSVPITSKVYYYQRVTGNYKRGLSVDHTPEAWYNAIARLVTDDELRNRLAKRGRSWVYKNRSIERNWRKWWDVYTQIYRRKR